MPEFQKIDLSAVPQDKKNVTIEPMSRRKRRSNVSFNIRHLNKHPRIMALLVFVVLLVIYSIFAGITLAKSVKKTQAQAKVLEATLKQQNIEQASTELQKTQEDLKDTNNKLHLLFYLQIIPGPNFYYNDAQHLINAGNSGLSGLGTIIDSLKPYADLLGLKGKGTFTGGTAEQRIQTAVLAMSKITPRIDSISEQLQDASSEMDKVNPNHYPPIGPFNKVRDQLDQIKTIADEGAAFTKDAKPLIKVLPSLLGNPDAKKYLVIFQNDKELRPTGGFMTAYAIFDVNQGVIKADTSSDMYLLDDTIANKPPAPAILQKYLNVSTLNLRDSNISPDFMESMKTFTSLYNKASGKTDVDGIIAIDTNVLVNIIKDLDDHVEAGGVTFTSQIVPQCNCPQAIYQLEELTDSPKNYDFRYVSLANVQAHRKDILGALLSAIMQKALKSSPKKYWGPLIQTMITQGAQKHILFDLFDQNAQQGITALNADGRIMSFDGDYLHINDANLGGAKSNMYVKESVEAKYDVSSDGSITKTLTLTYRNPFPPSNCNLQRTGGACLNGILRDWVRIYVPKGSTLVSSDGSEVKETTYDDLGKTVFEGFISVQPMGQTIYTVIYKLPFALKSGSPLDVMVQKQPGTYDNEYTLKNGGHTLEKFNLTSDKTLKISL